MTTQPGMDGATQRRARAQPPLLHQGQVCDDLRTLSGGRPRGRRLLPGPVEPRQGRPLDARRELHRLLLVEGLRQGRDHHVGDPADRLPLGRPRQARVRATRLPPGRRLLLVHLLARRGCATPTCAGCCWSCSARRRPSTTATRSWPGRTSSTTRSGPGLQDGARQGRTGPRHLGRGGRDRRRRARPHDQALGPRPGRRLLADPGDVDGLPRLGGALHRAHRRPDAVASTTGTPTCPSPHRRCSATRPTCPSRATGGTPAT